MAKHHHLSHPPPDSHSSLIDSLQDTFINAFSKVRKPDARFVEIGEQLERFEEGLGSVDKLVGRGKNRVDGESFFGAGCYCAEALQILRRTTRTWRRHTRAWVTLKAVSQNR